MAPMLPTEITLYTAAVWFAAASLVGAGLRFGTWLIDKATAPRPTRQ